MLAISVSGDRALQQMQWSFLWRSIWIKSIGDESIQHLSTSLKAILPIVVDVLHPTH